MELSLEEIKADNERFRYIIDKIIKYYVKQKDEGLNLTGLEKILRELEIIQDPQARKILAYLASEDEKQ